MPKRSHDAPITVVNRFDVKGDTERFEREFRHHSQYLRTREDFHFLVTVRLVDHPQVYVHLGHWRTMRGFLDTVHDDTFQAQVRKLGPMVDTEADQAVSVARKITGDAVAGAANVVLTRAVVHGDPHVFERQFAEANEHLAQLGGYGGSDLLRSTLRPDVYTAVQWWRDTDACEQALGDSGHRAATQAMTRGAGLTVERTRHVAYERVLN